MTILGVLLTDQLTLLGADSGERYPDPASGLMSASYVPKRKVEQLGDKAVLWAYYGNGQRGDALARWLRENASSLPGDWTECVRQIGVQWQEVSTRAGWEAYPGVGALIAGWLGGVQSFYVLPIGSAGGPLPMWLLGNQNPYFVGVATVAARVGFDTAKVLLPDANEAELFEATMKSTVRSVDDLWAANRHASEPLNLIQIGQTADVAPICGGIDFYAEGES